MNIRLNRRTAGLGPWLAAGLIALGLGPRSAPAQDPAPPAAEAALNRPETARAPYDPTITPRTVAFYEEQVRREPGSYLFRRELAGAYLARQREAGDIADAVRAEAAARQSLALTSRNNAAAATRLAQALLAQHRFPEALAVARDAARVDPKAERLVIDVLLELGDYDAATAALGSVATEPDDMNLLALRARFADIEGRPERALELMREAARLTEVRPDMPAEVVAWYHTMVGHRLIDSGHLDDGEAACRKALAIFPADYRAMTGMAEAAAFRGDHAGALKWATDATHACPQNPEALRLAAEACAGLGRADEAAAQARALRDLAHSFPRIYDRHWAMTCLDNDRDLDEALALARTDLALRHDSGAHDTLAWACLKKGLLDEADREMTLALARGTREAGMMHRAGQIARARGDQARADALLAQARALNPYVAPAARP